MVEMQVLRRFHNTSGPTPAKPPSSNVRNHDKVAAAWPHRMRPGRGSQAGRSRSGGRPGAGPRRPASDTEPVWIWSPVGPESCGFAVAVRKNFSKTAIFGASGGRWRRLGCFTMTSAALRVDGAWAGANVAVARGLAIETMLTGIIGVLQRPSASRIPHVTGVRSPSNCRSRPRSPRHSIPPHSNGQ
jgi:hypothetical protein